MSTTDRQPATTGGSAPEDDKGPTAKEVFGGLAVLVLVVAVAVVLHLLRNRLEDLVDGGTVIVSAAVCLIVVGDLLARRTGREASGLFRTLLGGTIAVSAVGAAVALVTGNTLGRFIAERTFGLVEVRVEIAESAIERAVPAVAGPTADITGGEMLVRLSDLGVAEHVAARLSIAAPLFVVLAAAIPLYALAGAMKAGDPFRARIPRRLRQCGAITAIGGSAVQFLTYGCHTFLIGRTASGTALTVPLETSFLPLLGGLALFALAEAFDHGGKLRSEVEGLI
ncbi:DUF2975 domain-containing protein [Streptosporangium roseum]|uniref:Uncharacterized protein n=1 Tax=Streptosporangium roseum (strain ATCC 12428 / DSM 43021 / JCM 3005 / KCTC 9067 / NCIMB 10171 / NRRL 2505 / NI 9100) TaxID=479432 RepID=D2AYC8_STRRD|nr:DUF2975 domain-containing protein [Streptosporangium roseum]ACZ87138.1 hypothetical protein Sros_4236 [Streptosporangium roseum DSM 43021]